nr:hypothetical protein RP007_01615 [Rhizobium sp. P007]
MDILPDDLFAFVRVGFEALCGFPVGSLQASDQLRVPFEYRFCVVRIAENPSKILDSGGAGGNRANRDQRNGRHNRHEGGGKAPDRVLHPSNNCRKLRALLKGNLQRGHPHRCRNADVLKLGCNVGGLESSDAGVGVGCGWRRRDRLVPAFDRVNACKRRAAVAVERGGHLVSRQSAGSMGAPDFQLHLLVVHDDGKKRIVLCPQAIELRSGRAAARWGSYAFAGHTFQLFQLIRCLIRRRADRGNGFCAFGRTLLSFTRVDLDAGGNSQRISHQPSTSLRTRSAAASM